MKIAIIGASGFLGTKLFNILSKNHEIVGTYSSREKEGLELLDATDAKSVEAFIRKHTPELVIDTIALTSSFVCEKDPELCEKLNYLTAKNILRACEKVRCILVFMSSSYLFEGERGNYSEADPVVPQNEYARTKIMAEKEILHYKNAIILRVDVMYGYNGKDERNGVFNQINLETMVSSAGDYVIDKNNIVLLSNTKDIVLNKYRDTSFYELSTASLFGNPVFYINGNIKNDAIAAGNDIVNAFTNPVFAGTISQLVGAEKEVKELSKLLKLKGWQTDAYLNYAATEKDVKKVESPRVLHIATHGFFMSDLPQWGESDFGEINENKSIENPLLRSGLLFSGGGDLLNAKTIYDLNSKNGILTAYEAMNLNLDNTELVVLSACATGLGEVQTGEGVYGLQRAFLVAGANTVIMSLFKVSDDITKELMTIFYRKWLATGDKRQSLIDAKKEIRAKYKYPYYWGGFVMIGMD